MMLSATSKDKKTPSASLLSALEQPCRHFSFAELKSATGNYDKLRCIARGGFGKVYIGLMNDGPTDIYAIKRLHFMSNQGSPEFWAEVKMLSRLRHCNLVSLVGYCNEGKEMVLVYEYMHLGSLYDHLHKKGTLLTWSQRLKICLGAARGLDYLHTGTGTQHGVIHRDVKSSNILLDQNYTAKISDFGLAKVGPTNQSLTHVSTSVRGTFGYMDPNYFYTGKLTRKSDVYAFGVVLLEVLCGRPALDESLDEGLAAWAQDRIKQGKLDQIIDSSIREQISRSGLKEFSRLAVRCLSSHPIQRPTMSEVVGSLNLALSFQERKVSPSQGENLIKKVWPLLSLKVQLEIKKEKNVYEAIIEIVSVPVPAIEDQKEPLEGQVANNDPLPAIVSLKITGYTFLGGELQATSYCINGAVFCTFQWFHHFSNGSSQYIVGATDPTYNIEIGDAGTYLGVEVVPMDKNGRKGICFKCSPNQGLINIPFPAFLSKVKVGQTEPLEEENDSNGPLPALENLQITGDAFPGGELQVSGICINGTVFCMFQWVRHLSDGSVEYIKGATGPNYTVVLGDIGTRLGVEVVPMDESRRYGICFKCYANDGLFLTHASQ